MYILDHSLDSFSVSGELIIRGYGQMGLSTEIRRLIGMHYSFQNMH